MNKCSFRTLRWAVTMAALISVLSLPCWALKQKRSLDLTTLDTGSGVTIASVLDRNDCFGYSVAADGDIVVVGVPKDDVSGTNSGAAYVFRRSSSGTWWTEQKIWVNEPGDAEHFGWSVAVDSTSQIIVVGAPYEDSSAHTNRGAVFVFKPGTTNPWVQVDKLEAHDGTTYDGDDGDHFGSAVAVHGTTIVVGAPDEDRTWLSTDQGAAYVFRNPTSNQWTSATKLTSDYRDENARFGYSVAVDAGTIVIGEPFRDCANDTNRGGAHFYEVATLPSTRRFECAPDPDGSWADHFGWSVAVAGNHVLVGTPGEGPFGLTYGYEPGTGTWDWVPLEQLRPTIDGFVTESDRHSGEAAAVYDASDPSHAPYFVSRAVGVVGAPDADAINVLPADIGAIDVFAWEPLHDWAAHVVLREPESPGSDHDTNDHFGHSVGVGAPTPQTVVVVAGAPYDNIGLRGDTGGAYLFEFEEQDTDDDGLADAIDNCLDVYNPSQRDDLESGSGDGVGDLCDNCPYHFNPNQDDDDFDERGNECDDCPHDTDNWTYGGCNNCRDDDGDGYYVGCDRYENRRFDNCDDDTDNWSSAGCSQCTDVDGDGYYVGCDRYLVKGFDYCDEHGINSYNWTSRGCRDCVDNDNDGHYVYCDQWSFPVPLGPDCDDGRADINLDAPDGVCDGVDNDCDTVPDNGQTPTTCGYGVCTNQGWLSCPDGVNTVEDCTALPPTGDDSDCNNIDENCDGIPDNNYVAEATSCGIGGCASTGQLSCQAGTVIDTCTEGSPSTELCDGIDNDCNGLGDDGLTPPPADLTVGVCSGSVKVCGGADGWVEPDYTAVPGYEAVEVSCDALDNDCDGLDDDGLTPPPADLTAGVCSGSVKTCSGAGGWIDPDYTAIAGYEALEATCDAVDNDCDSSTDEDASGNPLSQDCYTADPATRDVGVCTGGVETCTAGAYGACDGEITPTAELCDGLDNDCDGQDDDNLTAPPAGLTAGVCSGSVKVCAGADGWIEPDYTAIAEYEAVEVTCDAVDNDCDNSTDEDASGAALTQSCYSGPAGTAGVGVCTTGLQTCVGGSYGACEGDVTPTDEVCDGLDNDCNGQGDDNLTAPPADLTAGVCSGSVKVCAGADGWIEPDYAAIPGYEAEEVTCDGLDNDCNGQVDDDVYVFGGFLQPINSDGSSIFKAGRTIPVKVTLADCDGVSIPSATVTIAVYKVSDAVLGSVEELDVDASGNANTGNVFRYDPDGQQYIYNLSTKDYTVGTYRVTVSPDRGDSYSVDFSLK